MTVATLLLRQTPAGAAGVGTGPRRIKAVANASRGTDGSHTGSLEGRGLAPGWSQAPAPRRERRAAEFSPIQRLTTSPRAGSVEGRDSAAGLVSVLLAEGLGAGQVPGVCSQSEGPRWQAPRGRVRSRTRGTLPGRRTRSGEVPALACGTRSVSDHAPRPPPATAWPCRSSPWPVPPPPGSEALPRGCRVPPRSARRRPAVSSPPRGPGRPCAANRPGRTGRAASR